MFPEPRASVASVPGDDAGSLLPDPAPQPPDGYLDAVGGQPLLPAARAAWIAAVDQAWADPARLHHGGRRSGIVLDAARASIASSLGIRPDDVYFTSSGPTAIAIAIAGLVQARGDASRRVVASAVESLAVLEPASRTSDEVELVPVNDRGRLELDAFQHALDRPAALACVQAANAEVGTRQPLEEAAALAAARRVPLLVHAVQVIGRDPVPTHWDVLAASARDWGGPAGVGVLAVRPTLRWVPDASPDRGWVGGFPDIAAAASAATALEYLAPHREAESARLRVLVERIRREVPLLVPDLVVAGEDVDRLPHIVTFTCDQVAGEALVTELDRRGFSVASGSACTADARQSSQVIAAMGVSSRSSIRVSLPLNCTVGTVEGFLAALPDAAAAARGDG
jgi:cysteine desulfurase